ncbi:MAG: cupin domain-containing protein [Candidatus Micrarchaeota archaeon]|nr:cupin domain-containing protein [Candidatus Micrarchaeota archaeon]
MDKETALKKLKNDGYTKFLSWKDRPGKVYKSHFHFRASKIYVLNGSMKVKVGNNSRNYTEGQSVFVPKKAKHSAVVGRGGGTFLEGQK